MWDDACEYGIIGFEPEYKHNATYPYYGFFYKWWFGIIVRMLLPFRNVIGNRNVRAVLNMHKMQTKL